jgi:hypothetical protein
MPNGNLKANSLEIFNSGEVVIFSNGVVLNLDAEPKQ